MTTQDEGPRSPEENAELFEIAGGESDAIGQLTGCVERLREAQAAKQALARLTPGQLRAALAYRRLGVGKLS